LASLDDERKVAAAVQAWNMFGLYHFSPGMANGATPGDVAPF